MTPERPAGQPAIVSAPRRHRLDRVTVAWIVAWLTLIALVVAVMCQLRSHLVASLDTPEARADWDAWRKAADEQSHTGPVRRAKTQSPEPPTLVLLRDYFGTMLAAALVFSSLLFATAMIAVRGALGAGRKPARVVRREPWTP